MIELDFLEPERLRALVAVAETGNFTRAVRRLHLTQPTVSVQVRSLEDSIGCALFDWNAQFVRLTADGEAMLGYARELLAVLARAVNNLPNHRWRDSRASVWWKILVRRYCLICSAG
jgi:DNA-binding transcriptional LysR family regulator